MRQGRRARNQSRRQDAPSVPSARNGQNQRQASTPSPPNGSDGEPPALVSYLAILARRKWFVVGPLVLVPLIAFATTKGESPLYEASAQVLLSHQNLAASVLGITDTGAALQPDRVAQTQADLARVPEVAQRTLAAAGLRDRSSLQFLGQSSVATKSNADLLEFLVQDRKPAVAKLLATSYAQQFIAYRNQLDEAELGHARHSVQAHLRQLRSAGLTRSALYADLAAKNQQLLTIELLQTTGAQLVRRADAASRIRPRPERTAVLGVGLGVLLGLGLAFLVEALDTRVRTTSEIEKNLGVTLLGRLPAPPTGPTLAGASAMLQAPSGHYAESIRTLRVRLDLAKRRPSIRVLMVTSATDGEGKSTTAASLAIALAQAGRKVVLCDLDARRPVLDQMFGIEDRPGLVDVVLHDLGLDKALTPVTIPATPYGPGGRSFNGGNGRVARGGGMVEVLTFGHTLPDPAEFVGSDRVAEIMRELRDRSAIVLVDAPPLLGVGDAIALAGAVDGLLLIARLGAIRRSTLNELRRVLSSCPAPTIGFVATAAATGDGYGRGDGYRDGTADSHPVKRTLSQSLREVVRR